MYLKGKRRIIGAFLRTDAFIEHVIGWDQFNQNLIVNNESLFIGMSVLPLQRFMWVLRDKLLISL